MSFIVIVVGAGIAGLTTAAAFEVGAGIQLAPNATRLLRRFESIRLTERAVVPAATELRRWDDGGVLDRTVLGQACLDRFGAPYYTFHRADLHRCLLDLLPAGALVLGRRVVEVRETPDRAEVLFADDSTVTAHLAAEPKVTLWLGPGRHCVSYPVSAGEQISFGATTPAPDWRTESWTAPGRVADLLAGFAGWHDDVIALLSSAGTVNQWALHDRDPVEKWSRARVTLVGDAAHPMLPFAAQGANQAVEDAFVLAECLRDANRDAIPAALRRYESLRLPRTSDVQNRSRANQRQFHLTDDERQAGDGEAGLQALAALFGYDAAARAR